MSPPQRKYFFTLFEKLCSIRKIFVNYVTWIILWNHARFLYELIWCQNLAFAHRLQSCSTAFCLVQLEHLIRFFPTCFMRRIFLPVALYSDFLTVLTIHSNRSPGHGALLRSNCYRIEVEAKEIFHL